MADLIFGCTGATAERYAATPTLTFSLTITERSGVRVHAIALRCQIRIEPHRRRYSPTEAQRLHDLFGDPSQWAETVKPIQLATVTTMVPTFTAVTETDLTVPVTYDLEVTSARYLHGLDDGTIPLLLLFSGTVFVANGDGFSIELVPWSAEASFRMPVSVWRDLVDIHFPNSAWLRCSRETLDELSAFKAKRALPTWDATLEALLTEAGEPATSAGGDATPPEAPAGASRQGMTPGARTSKRYAASPTPSCTRATSCPRTGPRARRAAAAGSSAWSWHPGTPRSTPRRAASLRPSGSWSIPGSPSSRSSCASCRCSGAAPRARREPGTRRWNARSSSPSTPTSYSVPAWPGSSPSPEGKIANRRPTRGSRSGGGNPWPASCSCAPPRCRARGGPSGCRSGSRTGPRPSPRPRCGTRRCRPRWSPRT